MVLTYVVAQTRSVDNGMYTIGAQLIAMEDAV